MFGEWFTEDEDDIFMGSPKSKFFDVSKTASQDIVEEEWDKIVEKVAALEMMLSQGKDENFDINEEIKEFKLENEKELEAMKKGLYVEFTGEIICRLDS
tara:strand:+ start:655 stop:951 length:297 start_codon:yes stop_codon:yes gene_type:complete